MHSKTPLRALSLISFLKDTDTVPTVSTTYLRKGHTFMHTIDHVKKLLIAPEQKHSVTPDASQTSKTFIFRDINLFSIIFLDLGVEF